MFIALFCGTRISDIKNWMIENKLQLNDEKTECLLIPPNKCTHNLIYNFNLQIEGTIWAFDYIKMPKSTYCNCIC